MTFVVTSEPEPALRVRGRRRRAGQFHVGRASDRRRLPLRRPAGPGGPGTRGALLRPGRSRPPPGMGRVDHGDRRRACPARRQRHHRRTGRRRRAVRATGPDAAAAIALLAADRGGTALGVRRGRFRLALLGTDPLRPARRVNPGGRYAAMERYFIATRTASAGAAMMTSTASVQVNLGRRSARRLDQAGPPRACAGPDHDRDRRQLTDARGQVHRLGLHPPAGVGPVGLRAVRSDPGASTDPATDWARYALKAPVMLVQTPDGAQPLTEHVPFADWADGVAVLGGRRPTAADLDYHLTTLFPPVRPRGIPGDPLPGQPAGLVVAGRGVPARHPARRPGGGIDGRRGRRTRRHGLERRGPRRSGGRASAHGGHQMPGCGGRTGARGINRLDAAVGAQRGTRPLRGGRLLRSGDRYRHRADRPGRRGEPR